LAMFFGQGQKSQRNMSRVSKGESSIRNGREGRKKCNLRSLLEKDHPSRNHKKTLTEKKMGRGPPNIPKGRCRFGKKREEVPSGS